MNPTNEYARLSLNQLRGLIRSQNIPVTNEQLDNRQTLITLLERNERPPEGFTRSVLVYPGKVNIPRSNKEAILPSSYSIPGIRDWMSQTYNLNLIKIVKRKRNVNSEEKEYLYQSADGLTPFDVVSILPANRLSTNDQPDTIMDAISVASSDFIVEMFNLLGFDKYQGVLADFIDLFYLIAYSDFLNYNIPREVISYVSGLSISDLEEVLLPFFYLGPRSKSDLTFATLTGTVGYESKANNSERYSLLTRYSPNVMWLLAKAYGINSERDLELLSPPYEYVSETVQPKIEPILLYVYSNIDYTNIRNVLEYYGFNISDYTPLDIGFILDYFNQVIPDISIIINRGDISVPPSLKQLSRMNERNAIKTLREYTDKELILYYDIPNKEWLMRSTIINGTIFLSEQTV